MPNNNQNISHLPTDETLAAGLAAIVSALGGGALIINDFEEGQGDNFVSANYTFQDAYNAFIAGKTVVLRLQLDYEGTTVEISKQIFGATAASGTIYFDLVGNDQQTWISSIEGAATDHLIAE